MSRQKTNTWLILFKTVTYKSYFVYQHISKTQLFIDFALTKSPYSFQNICVIEVG